jgi:2,5-dihydroxypyridine 5,6-dioxygenase
MAETVAKAEMVALFREELALCRVNERETVAVLSEGDQLRDYAEAFLIAARELGAAAVDVNLPAAEAMDASERIANIGQNALSANPEALETLKRADMVVDHMLLLFSKEQIALQQAGTRILLAVEPFEILERLFPTPRLRQRVEAAAARLERAETLRFTHPAGTDITYQLGTRPLLTEYGYTDTPGRWDHWPGGFLATVAMEGGIEGRVVMARDDIVFPLKCFIEAPTEFVIRDGYVTDILGGDADKLKRFMDSYDDPRAYAVSHIGWGLNELCKWDAALPGIGMDGRAYYGNVLFSLGPDTEFGGANDTACHMDLPMRGCDLYLDDEPIVRAGEVLPADMRAAGRQSSK